MSAGLSKAFLANLPVAARGAPQGELDEALARAIERGRTRWPKLTVDPEGFVAVLAERVEPGTSLAEAVERLHIESLYLARACVEGDAGAAAAFRDAHGRDIDVALRRLRLSTTQADEARSAVLTKLLVAEGKLASYSGHGELGNWVRAVTAREAISQQRRRTPEPLMDDPASEEFEDPELDYLKQHYRGEFKEAFQAALAELEPDDRTVLRYRFVDQLTLDQLAIVLDVHRATGARWLARIRETLLKRTQANLRAKLKIAPQELESIVRLIQSHFDVSMTGFLRADRLSAPDADD